MNRMEQALYDEITRLLDRLAASVPEGSLDRIRTASPGLDGRLQEAEGRLAQARALILEGYGQWRRGLEDIENLWALAAWRSAAEEPAEPSPSLAA